MNLPFAAIASFSPLVCSSRPELSNPLTVPLTPKPMVTQLIVMLVTLLSVTTPLPLNTRQSCRGKIGGDSTVTLYDAPLSSAVGNVNGPFAVGVIRSPPLFAIAKPAPDKPLMVPPIVNSRVAHVTTMFSTSRSATTPVPLCTEHACAGLAGCVLTVTLNAEPLGIRVAKAKPPLVCTPTSSPPLFCNTRPEPTRPVTVPRI